MSGLQPIAESELIEGLNMFYFKYLGIWGMINTYRTSGKVTLNFRVQWVLTLLLGVPPTLFQFCCPAYIKVDLEKATLLILNTVTCIQMLVRQGVFWLNVDGHAVLFGLMSKNILTSIPKHNQAEAKQIYARIAKKCNIFCYFVIFVNLSTVVMWTFMPSIRSEYVLYHVGNMRAVTTGPKKILGGWYPVPFDKQPWAMIAYAYEFLLVWWCGIVVTLYEVTVTLQVMTLYAHLTVLKFHITTLNKTQMVSFGRPACTKREADDLLYEEFLAIIRDHQKLLRFGKTLKNSYIGYITMLLATGGVILIICIFQFLFGEKDTLSTIQFMVYLCFEVTEFIILCFTTTMLETSCWSFFLSTYFSPLLYSISTAVLNSVDIGFSVYSSEWYTSDKKLRNAAQMLMVRSQKPLSLVAYEMYHVNMETLMSIFQFTYSVSALLSRMVE